MSGQSSGGGGGGGDSAGLGLVYGVGVTVLILMLIYSTFHNEVIYFLFKIKYYELRFISFFVPKYQGLVDWIQNVDISRVTLEDVGHLSRNIGAMLKAPFIFISLILMVVIYYYHPDREYRAIEDMSSLRDKLQDDFPCTRPVESIDLVKTSIDEGSWAMGATPVEFAKQHHLIYRDNETDEIKLDKQRAQVAFSKQLGRLWTGIDDLEPHEQALFAVLAAFANYQRSLGDKMLDQFSASASVEGLRTGRLNFADVDVLLDRFGKTEPVELATSKHAYVYTVFSRLLQEARTSGIVASAGFLWLKPIDRQLWYTLNNVGRRAVFSETAAVHAHYLAEERLDMAIEQPMVDEAVHALEVAISRRIIRDLN